MKLKLYLPLSLVVLILAACAPPPQLLNEDLLQDTSLVTGDPCEAPCWRGITPGETSWNDAQTIIEDSADLTNFEVLDVPEDEAARAATFTTAGGQQCCQMFSEDGDVVSNIFVLLAPPDPESNEPQNTLGAVIERYGEPTYMQGEDVTPDQTFIALLYEDKPLIVYVFGDGITVEGTELSEDSPVIGAVYLTPDDVGTVIEANNLYTWAGYGTLIDLFDGEFDRTAEAVIDE